MKNRITPHDYELISAYLDNQLGNKERTNFESRLNAIPELQKELHELSKTRSMLRSMPRVRAPRNYFVTAKMVPVPVGLRQPSRYAPVMGIISAIATILLVLVFFGENFINSTTPVALAPAPVQTEQLLTQPEAKQFSEATVPPAEAAPSILMQAPAAASPTPTAGPSKVVETGLPTPTTVYLYVYPPTTTPERQASIMSELAATETLTCDDYLKNPTYPIPTQLNCSTPTGSPEILQNFSITVSTTPTSTITPTSTATPTPTATSTFTSTPTPSPTPTPTETVSPILESAPAAGPEVPMESTTAGTQMDTSNAAPQGTIPLEESQPSGNNEFVQYLLLALKLGLAGIAIGAGISAILLRMRSA